MIASMENGRAGFHPRRDSKLRCHYPSWLRRLLLYTGHGKRQLGFVV
jgi:hypothetical protein